jgi:hypothetical protein
MMLKKFEEFKNSKVFELNNEDRVPVKNKEELMELVKNHPKTDEKSWYEDEHSLIQDIRRPLFDLMEKGEIDNTYDLAEYAADKYGAALGFAMLITDYIYQVNNGGHNQYWGNGYASAETDGAFGNHDEMGQHELLLELWEESGFNKFSRSGKLSFEVAKDFELETDYEMCEWCGGSGQEEEEVELEDEDGETYTDIEYNSCGNCGGDGEVDRGGQKPANDRELDSRLYDVNGRIIDDLKRFLLIQYVN